MTITGNMTQGQIPYHNKRAKISAMDTYDRMPKALREALANSDHNWSAQQIAKLRRDKAKHVYKDITFSFATLPETIEAIRNQDLLAHRTAAEQGIVCTGQR